MNEMKSRVVNNFHEISETPLWDSSMPISLEDYNALLTELDTEKLCELLEKPTSIALEEIKIETLMKMPFPMAQKTIDQFSLAKRIDVLEHVETLRIYLYSQASRYGEGKPTDPEYLSVDEWKIIMGKIKHLEILQAWLYGIN